MIRRTASFLIVFVLMCGSASMAGTIHLPRTGQTTCYDTSGNVILCAGTGQDGDIRAGVAWPNPRFVRGTGVESECITDTLTGLMWPKNGYWPVPGGIWTDTLDFVANRNSSGGFCGHTDWRMPNVNELESLVNVGQPNMAAWLNTQGFTNVQSTLYWSSSTPVDETIDAFMVNMPDGFVFHESKGSSFTCLWPVRAGQAGGVAKVWQTGQTKCYNASGIEIPCAGTGQDGDTQAGVVWPSPRFSDQGNGTVIDNLTGLLWTKDANAPGPWECTPGNSKTWQAAFDYVKCLNAYAYLGYADWRLPNRKELFSLIDYSRYLPALPDGRPFTNVQLDYYWSSSTYAAYATNTKFAWIVAMANGWVVYDDKRDRFVHVWPVRGGMECYGKVRVIHTDQQSEYYDTLQAAYSAAVQGDRIQAQAITFTENLVVANPVAVTLEGGYDCAYSSNTDGMTSLRGMLQTYPDAGTLTIENFIITDQ